MTSSSVISPTALEPAFAGGRRVGVSDLGLRECRQVCEAAAKLYRFQEGK